MIEVGDLAPNFALDGVEGDGTGQRQFSLDAFRGAPVVLVFYPSDSSPVCTAQLRSYTDDMTAFASVGAQVLALSPQSVADHVAFAKPLLIAVVKRCRHCNWWIDVHPLRRRCLHVRGGQGQCHSARLVVERHQVHLQV